MKKEPLKNFKAYVILAAIAWTVISAGLMWVNRQSTQHNILTGYGLHWLIGLAALVTIFKNFQKGLRERELLMIETQKKEKEYRDILQTSMEGFLLTDPAGRILDVNDAYCTASGYSREALLNMNISDVEALESPQEIQRRIKKIQTEGAAHFETIHKRSNHEIAIVEVSVKLLQNGKFASFIRDITEKKRAEDLLRASEQKFSKVFQYSPALVTLSNLEDGRYIEVNQKFLEVSEFTREEVIGKTSVELGWIGKKDREQLKQKMLTQGRIANHLLELRTKSGKKITCIYHGEIIELEGKSLLLSLAQDVTQKVQAEKDLKESKKRLIQAQALACMGSYTLDIQDGIWISSAELNNIFGIDADFPRTVEGWLSLVHPDDRAMMAAYLKDEVLGKGKDFNKEYRIVNQSTRQERWVFGKGELEFNEQGAPIRMFGMIQDITERKAAQETQARLQKKYENLIQTIEGIVWEADAATFEFSFISKQVEYILGYTAEEWLAEPKFWENHIHPEDREKAIGYCAAQTQLMRPHEFEYRMIAANQSIIWISNIVSVIVEDNQPVKLRGIMIDVTGQKAAEEKLRQLSMAVEQNPASVVITDTSGKIKYVNPKFSQVSGYALHEILDQNPRILKSGNVPPETYRSLWQTITAGGVWRGELQNKKKNGELFWEDAQIAPIKDGVGRITHFVAVKEDITERKKRRWKPEQGQTSWKPYSAFPATCAPRKLWRK